MGLYTGVGLYTGGLIHRGFKSVSIFIRNGLIGTFFPQIIMYFNDFCATWAYTRGGYTRVLKLRSESGRF